MSIVKEKTKMKGILKFSIIKNGKVIETFEEENLIVDLARYAMAHLIGAGGTNSSYIDQIGFGTGTTATSPDDTALTSPLTKSFDSVTYPEDNSVQFNWTLLESEANGMAITEFGLFSHNGNLFSRKVRGAINKESDFSISGSWKIIF